MRVLIHDYETMSDTDLKKSGAWAYAEAPTTSVVCLGWQLDDGPVRLWKPGDPLDELTALAEADDVLWVAHNAAFEKAIHRSIMHASFGLPIVPGHRWHCTQSVCAMKGIPLKLEKAATALGLHQRQNEGHRNSVLALSRTNKQGYYDHSGEKLQKVYDECAQDVRAEVGLHRRIKWLSKSERDVWKLDQKINERGVKLDMAFVAAAQKVCDQASKPLHAEFIAITGGISPSQPKFKDWLHAQGVAIPNLQKETIATWLGEQDDEEAISDVSDGQPESLVLPAHCERALRIRSILGSASIKKLRAMGACCASDGRAHGLLQYHGAGPGRWAGRLLQPQNFPRPSLKQVCGWDAEGKEILEGHDAEQLVAAIMSGDSEYVRCLYGEPIDAVANGLRHAIIADREHLLEVGDYAKIECVIVLALAGHADTARGVIERGSAVYTDMAAKIFKRPVAKSELREYTIGKNTILGCGFQMGAAKFQSRYCPDDSIEFAQAAIDEYRKVFAPKVPRLWYALEDAAVKAVWDRLPQEAYGVTYALEDGWLTARLPSGRKLWYYDPRPVRKAMPWSTPEEPDIRPGFEYSAWKMGQWKRISAYGGLLTENVVQALARDLLVNGMMNCEAAGHGVILTVHDEIVTEVKKELSSANALDQMMTDVPSWAVSLGIPVASECWVGTRYRK
jgi:DNA polymerase